jgi:oxygen-dependent protoporphyrinogen oxidase
VTEAPSVVVIGGGIAGLAAAFELHTRAIPFVLLEVSDRLGGLIFSEQVDGFTIDAGADSLLVQKRAGIEFCEALGLGSRLMPSTPPRTAFVHARGRLHKLPSPSILGIPTTEAGIAAYDLLPETARATLLARTREPRNPRTTEPGSPGTPEPPEDESVADFFRREFGPETVGLIAEPLLGGIHAGDVERLSIASVAPRLAAHGRVRGRAMRDLLDSTQPQTQSDGLFRSLPRGMGEIVEAVEQRIPSSSIRRRSAVRSIARADDDWRVGSTSGDVTARAVVIAAPAHAAAEMLSPIDRDIAALCAAVPYVSTASVALAWPRADVHHPLDGSGFVVARQHSDLRITACTWASSKWPNRTPPGMSLLRAFLGGATDPDAASLSDGEILGIAVRDVSRVLGIQSSPALARVHRWIRAGAQHNVGHRARVEDLERRLERAPGLFVAGSGFRSIGVPDCIADGRAAARRALDYAKIAP